MRGWGDAVAARSSTRIASQRSARSIQRRAPHRPARCARRPSMERRPGQRERPSSRARTPRAVLLLPLLRLLLLRLKSGAGALRGRMRRICWSNWTTRTVRVGWRGVGSPTHHGDGVGSEHSAGVQGGAEPEMRETVIKIVGYKTITEHSLGHRIPHTSTTLYKRAPVRLEVEHRTAL